MRQSSITGLSISDFSDRSAALRSPSLAALRAGGEGRSPVTARAGRPGCPPHDALHAASRLQRAKALVGAPAQARLPRWGAPFRPGLRPGRHFGLRLSAGRVDFPRPMGFRTSASQKPQRGSRASRAPGAPPPNHYRAAGAALRSHDAMPRWGTPSGRLRRCCAAPRGRLPPAAGRGPAGAAGACPCPRFRGSPSQTEKESF